MNKGNESLKLLREELEQIDRKILPLLEQRLDLGEKIGQLKKTENRTILDLKREEELFVLYASLLKDKKKLPYVRGIMKQCMTESKNIQLGTKILFTDLDGTLLNDQKEIPEENRAAIKEALELNHIVTVTTGRTFESAMQVTHQLGLDIPGCYLICYNGAIIYDFKEQKSIIDMRMTEDQIQYLFSEAYKYDLYVQTYHGGKIWTNTLGKELLHYSNASKMEYEIKEDVVADLTELPNKVLLIDFDKEKLLRFQEEHKEWEQGNCSSLFSCDEYLEYCPLEASKGQGLIFLANYLGIPIENTVAVGDEENDISMIRAAGCGIAMKNAKDYVKEVADFVTSSNNDCGVAKVIRMFLS